MGHDGDVCGTAGCRAPKGDRGWGPGPWAGEPDRIDFRAFGLPCFAHRNEESTGAWCGYVGVPRAHPAFGHHYDEVPVDVHGGLTYAAKCRGHICHPGRATTWWFGWDTAHAGDLCPAIQAMLARLPAARSRDGDGDEHYWRVGEVCGETARLAHQLAGFRGHHLLPRGGHHARDARRDHARWLRAGPRLLGALRREAPGC